MSYLRLISNNVQKLAETVASVLDVEVAIADKNLTRIVGTGQFYDVLDEECADDSLFAKIIETGEPIVNMNRSINCSNCSSKKDCMEFANMSHPIKLNKEIIGVVSFATFNKRQTDMIRLRKQEYFNMLKETARIVESEIQTATITNRLNKEYTEVNEIINCLDKGIVILNSEKEILQINSKALEILDLNLSKDIIIGENIGKFIGNISYEETNDSKISIWKIQSKNTKIMYSLKKIVIDKNKFTMMLSFDVIEDIINIAKSYDDKSNIQFKNIVGESRKILEAINKSKIAAKTDSTILLLGDSGTGKELFARSIHNESNRKNGPFVVINCGSIPDNLIESELFGYEKGAFTGANLSGKKGKIELANNGTLFLDEIGDLPLHLQTRLLRVLQEKSIDRLGGQKPIRVNIRVVSATNKDLIKLVKEGKFRLDLYYRLNIIPIELPALKDRGEDVLLCSKFIINKLSKDMNIEKKKLSKEVKKRFLDYNWAGNIRELENVLEHGMCFSEGEYIRMENLPDYFINKEMIFEKKEDTDLIEEEKSLEELKIDFEKKVIDKMLSKYGDDTEGKKKVAEKLDIGLTTLYRKINE